jgi:hypothetical protein
MPNAELLHSALHGVATAAKQGRVLRGCPLLELGRQANDSLALWRERPNLMQLYAEQVLAGLRTLRIDLLPEKTSDAVVRLLGVLRWIASQ